MDEPERPGPDADASEIAAWIEDHFDWAITEGMRKTLEGDGPEVDSDEGDGA